MHTEDDSDSGGQWVTVTYVSAEEIAKLPPVPDAPPSVVLATGPGTPDIKGRLVFADWDYINPDASLSLEDSATEVWPDPVHRRGRTVFEFPTAAQPFWVEAYLFTAIDSTTGVPVDPATGNEAEDPEYEFRYKNGSESEDSVAVGSDSVTVDALPKVMRPDEYVAVFAAWYIHNLDPELDPETDELGGYVTATWRFHFANE